ncbi:MAG: radical SAM protein [Promethearchaeota archaeon]
MEIPYEIGPIRPPSEAQSLLIRVTRNCHWNKCIFCPVYKGKKFELRNVKDVKEDIKTASQIYGDHFSSAFLQDSDSLVIKTHDLVEIISTIKEYFPRIQRITSYSRARTVARKKESDIKALSDAGLSRLHIGLESGSDKVLEFVKKGATATMMIDAGLKIRNANISLCYYVMPGLGGKNMSREHAVKTASVLNVVNPDFIRIRSLFISPNTPFYELKNSGEFEELSEIEMVREIRLLIKKLNTVKNRFVSDHNLNLLLELNGNLPQDKERLLNKIDKFLSLEDADKINFIVGRRASVYRVLSDLEDDYLYTKVRNFIDNLKTREIEIDDYLHSLKEMYI